MAQVVVKNSLNPNKVVKVGISFIQVVAKDISEGDAIWALEIGVNELDVHGKKIPPYYITDLDLERIDDEIREGVGYVCSKVDWGNLLNDTIPPVIKSVLPNKYIVDMMNTVEFTITDREPSSGIDLSSLKVEVNGIDVTDELGIYGNVFEYRVMWHPKLKFYKTFI